MRWLSVGLAALVLGCSIEAGGLRGDPERDSGVLDAALGAWDGAAADGSRDAGALADALPSIDVTPVSTDASTPGDDAGACRLDPTPPGSGRCPDECTGGCEMGVCTIDCRGDGRCDDPSIVCPPDYACVIQCEGNDACDDGSITCPPDYPCRLECGTGENACGYLDFYCGNASCTADCTEGDCSTLTVHCPPGGSCAEC